MNTECIVPDWVHDVFIGYGDPAAANYKQMPSYIETMDWNDTFLDMEHLKACFPEHVVEVSSSMTVFGTYFFNVYIMINFSSRLLHLKIKQRVTSRKMGWENLHSV